MTDKTLLRVATELEAIKRLLILQMLITGTRQKDIALMLGISEATMSRMIPRGLESRNRKGDFDK